MIEMLTNPLFYIVVAGLIVAFILVRRADQRPSPQKQEEKVMESESISSSPNEPLPYKCKDSVLTTTERTFYTALLSAIGTQLMVCPKVGVKDFMFISKDTKDYMKYWGKISQKHIDFLICNPSSMMPICGIELDDSSHNKEKAKERDAFVEKMYKDANFPLVRFKTKPSYTANEIKLALNTYIPTVEPTPTASPTCPKCQAPMVVRTSRTNGNKFYGCTNYPNCKTTAPLPEEVLS